MTAQWLRQLGHEAYVLEGGVAAARAIEAPRAPDGETCQPTAPATDRGRRAARRSWATEAAQVIDLRPSMTYRKEHIAGAVWSIRPRVATACESGKAVVLVAERPEIAALAALDLAEAGVRDVRVLAGGHEAARAAGLPMASTPDDPADADCIDFLFFTAGRHEGDEAAARQYLTWEIGLVDQLDAASAARSRSPGRPKVRSRRSSFPPSASAELVESSRKESRRLDSR